MRAPWIALAVFLPAAIAAADEGQWPPGMLDSLDRARLAEMGLEIPIEALYDGAPRLVQAAINYSGCSGAFISKDGLMATNHHCAYRAIQAASSVEHDYLKDGFVAKTRADEIQAKGRGTLWVLDRIEDVTDQVRKAALSALDDSARRPAADRAALALAEACERDQPGVRCEVKAVFFGARYERHRMIEIKDLRLVFAPPSSVGEYGGDIDNWMWPRHTGDFTLLRAYVGPDGQPAEYAEGNVPYTPPKHFEVGHEGVAPGDFVAILGYPGHTDRYLWYAALEHHVERALPAIVDLYGEWLQILEGAQAVDRALAIKVAAHKKSLANRHKNARGMLAGIHRMKLLERRKQEAGALLRWAKAERDLEATQALSELTRMSEASQKSFPKTLLLDRVSSGPRLLGAALDLVRAAEERLLPEGDRLPRYQTRNRDRLYKGLERTVADYDPRVETAMLASWLRRADALPIDQRLAAVDAMKARLRGTYEDRARALLLGTNIRKLDVLESVFANGTPTKIRGSQDSLLLFAQALLPDVHARDKAKDGRTGRLIRLAPDYLRALGEVRKGPVYPDANGTLRISYAQVMGYVPRDGLLATPQTTLQGQISKHTGEDPFDLPEAIRAAAAAAKDGYFADPRLEDVPVCFLSNGDTTGGNSGSPVIDGRGRWVGLNFDRVWENIAGDVAYNPPQSRNISVDVRYVLWLIVNTPGTEALAKEMGIAEVAKGKRRPAPAAASADRPATPKAPAASKCSCDAPRSAANAAWIAWLPLLAVLVARRR